MVTTHLAVTLKPSVILRWTVASPL